MKKTNNKSKKAKELEKAFHKEDLKLAKLLKSLDNEDRDSQGYPRNGVNGPCHGRG